MLFVPIIIQSYHWLNTKRVLNVISMFDATSLMFLRDWSVSDWCKIPFFLLPQEFNLPYLVYPILIYKPQMEYYWNNKKLPPLHHFPLTWTWWRYKMAKLYQANREGGGRLYNTYHYTHVAWILIWNYLGQQIVKCIIVTQISLKHLPL